MKTLKLIIAATVLVVAGIGSAWADHRSHVHFGVMIGSGWGPGYYYPPAYYYPPYYPPVVIERQEPPVYIQQAAPAPSPAATNYWYYCAAAKGYYPYVKECPSGWQPVAPQPPGQP